MVIRRLTPVIHQDLLTAVKSLHIAALEQLGEDFFDFHSAEDLRDWLQRNAAL